METVEGELHTPDGYWRVQIIRYGPRDRWYRVTHGTTVVGDRLPIAAVQRILGDAFGLLVPVEAAAGDDGAA